MTQTGRRARVAHTIPGRLRIRFEGADVGPTPDAGLDTLRFVPGVLAVETRPSARSAVIRYDPDVTSEAAILIELGRAGIEMVAAETSPPSPLRGAERESPEGQNSATTQGDAGKGAA